MDLSSRWEQSGPHDFNHLEMAKKTKKKPSLQISSMQISLNCLPDAKLELSFVKKVEQSTDTSSIIFLSGFGNWKKNHKWPSNSSDYQVEP